MDMNDIDNLRTLLLKALIEYGKEAVDDMVNQTYGLIPTEHSLHRIRYDGYRDHKELLLEILTTYH